MSQKLGVTLSDEAFAELLKAYEMYLKECSANAAPDKKPEIPLSITGYAAVMLQFGVQTKFMITGTD